MRCYLSLLVCLLVWSTSLHAQLTDYEVRNFDSGHGMRMSSVLSIAIEPNGFIWVGTQDGIDLFDGYSFEQMPHIYTHKWGFKSAQPIDVLRDSKGNIWAATPPLGLNLHDPIQNTFTYFLHDTLNDNSLSDDNPSSLFEDKNGTIWVGTSNGLNKITPVTKDSFVISRHYPFGQTLSLQNKNRVEKIEAAENGNFWIGTNDGLFHFDPDKNLFTHASQIPELQDHFFSLPVHAILHDRENNLWIGTPKGAVKWNKNDHTLQPFFQTEPLDTAASINCFHEDSQGRIWIGTGQNGCGVYFPREDTMILFRKDAEHPNKINSNDIQTIGSDENGNIWIGGSTGLTQIHFRPSFLKAHFFPKEIITSVGYNWARSFYLSPLNGLWIGTSYAGVINTKWDEASTALPNLSKIKIEKHYHTASPTGWQLGNNSVIALFEDANHSLWVGTGGGVDIITSEGVINYKQGGDSVSGRVGAFLLTQDSTLWIGGWGGGLFKVEFPDGKWGYKGLRFKQYKNDPKNGNSLISNSIRTLLEDRLGNIWIGTHGKGLDKFDPKTETFTHFDSDSRDSTKLLGGYILGLALNDSGHVWTAGTGGFNNINPQNNTLKRFSVIEYNIPGIISVVIDKNENLWGVYSGLYKFNPRKQKLTAYKNDLFDMSSCGTCNVRTQSGRVFMGIKKGFFHFHPDSIITDKTLPEVMITRFDLFNEKVTVGKKDEHDHIILPKALHTLKEISLNHDQSVFTIHFSSLHHYHPEDCRYAYRMDGLKGFENRWIETNANTRSATFTNLTPGKYTFQVKSSNHNGVWNETPKELHIHVTPPWWQTTWAYICYTILLAGLIYLVIRTIIIRERMRNQVAIKSQEAAQLAELDSMRTRFFANISHEFRTPLTLILGPLEDKLGKSELTEADSHLFRSMRKNAQRLLSLINQLLDLSRLEAGKLQLKLAPGDIHTDLRQMASAFESVAAQKQIEYRIDVPEKPKGVSYDREKLETIVNNLLGNAFKFTPEGGRVSLQCSVSSMQAKSSKLPTTDRILVSVSDSGPGIPKEKRDQVFNRFYQSDDTATRNFEGTGIGLALSRELVELYGGTISVESEVGSGTTFLVELPLAQADWQGSTMVALQPNRKTKTGQTTAPTASADAPTLLLVEDNEDLRQYLRDSLEDSYQILEASNGQIGLSIAQEHIPDLIISDVMMPVMDGFTFCEKTKTDARTSHVPVIMLTALADRGHRIEGLETGADDYLAKPFDAQELRVRVANLIEQRRKLREKYQRQSPLSPKDIAVTSADERFLEKINKVLESNYAESEFSIETFAAQMSMSRMQLLRKIKALTGEKPSELLKNFRLQRAAQLLGQGHASVSEVGYLVGFSTPAHFSRSFRALYNASPSEYGK